MTQGKTDDIMVSANMVKTHPTKDDTELEIKSWLQQPELIPELIIED